MANSRISSCKPGFEASIDSSASAPISRAQIFDFGLLTRRPVGATRRRANPGSRVRRIETRTDDHRKNKFVPAIDIRQGMEVINFHINLTARLDIGDGLCKDV